MIRLGDYLWRPRRVFNSVGDWAAARGCQSALLPLPALQSVALADADTEAARWHVAQLSPGKVVGDLRLAATADYEVLGQTQGLHGIGNPSAHWVTRQLRLRWPKRLRGTGAVLATAAGANYYHWLFDSLPRLHLLKTSGVDLNCVDSFLINQRGQKLAHETLQLLGISAGRTFACSKRQLLAVERLLLPPMPTAQPGQIVPWVCAYLRKSFLSARPADARGQRLYLSRRGSSKRRLANEEAVEDLFAGHDFKILRPEELAFSAQVAAFASASFVAGPHGAAFANLVFATPGTGVLEFFHPSHPSNVYRDLAAEMNLRYQSIVGEAPDETAPAMSEKLGPYTVSLPQLKQQLADFPLS